jgi:aryl-alcohol dehydrogenase
VQYNASSRRPDGSCTLHANGEPLACSFFYQSSFATYAIAHHRNIVKVANDLRLDVIAPLGCGIQTGAGAVLNRLKVRQSSSLAVFGIGAVGLAAVMAGKVAGCNKIVAIDVHDSRLSLAMELGATHVINARKNDVVQQILECTGGGADYAVEATGVPAVVAQAVAALGPTGAAVLLGVMPYGATIELPAAALSPGKTLYASIEGDSVPDEFIPKLIDFYRAGKLPLERLITYYDLANIDQAAEDSKSGATIKPVIRMPI